MPVIYSPPAVLPSFISMNDINYSWPVKLEREQQYGLLKLFSQNVDNWNVFWHVVLSLVSFKKYVPLKYAFTHAFEAVYFTRINLFKKSLAPHENGAVTNIGWALTYNTKICVIFITWAHQYYYWYLASRRLIPHLLLFNYINYSLSPTPLRG